MKVLEIKDEEIKKRVAKEVEAISKKMLESVNQLTDNKIKKATDFVAHKTTDTPTDALNMVNRKFVTLNGTTANRPPSSILGQYYFDTTIGRPIWWNGSAWIKADGTAV